MLVKKPGKCAGCSHKYGRVPAFHSSINRQLPSSFRQQTIEVYYVGLLAVYPDMSRFIQADSDDNDQLPVIEVDLEVGQTVYFQIHDNSLKPSQ